MFEGLGKYALIDLGYGRLGYNGKHRTSHSLQFDLMSFTGGRDCHAASVY